MNGREATDARWMARCLELAAEARYTASPNPMVGCVLVNGKGELLAEGWHVAPGEAHAEVVALEAFEKAGGQRADLGDAVLYVNLEPCSHHGRTPPCCERIAAASVGRVVVGTPDPFVKVAGRGIAFLRDRGIDVRVGVLEAECAQLNRTFFMRHTAGRPFVTLKWAQSRDGFMDPQREPGQLGSIAITGSEAQAVSHGWRAAADIVVVGAGTVETDDPALTVRAVEGPDPVRWVLDPNGRTSSKARVYGPGRVAVWGGPKDLPPHGECLDIPRSLESGGDSWPAENARAIVRAASDQGEQGALHIYVEGGRATLDAFLEADLWDEICVIEAPHNLGSGLLAPILPEVKTAQNWLAGTDRINLYTRP